MTSLLAKYDLDPDPNNHNLSNFAARLPATVPFFLLVVLQIRFQGQAQIVENQGQTMKNHVARLSKMLRVKLAQQEKDTVSYKIKLRSED